jgi:hypothetical protein
MLKRFAQGLGTRGLGPRRRKIIVRCKSAPLFRPSIRGIGFAGSVSSELERNLSSPRPTRLQNGRIKKTIGGKLALGNPSAPLKS